MLESLVWTAIAVPSGLTATATGVFPAGEREDGVDAGQRPAVARQNVADEPLERDDLAVGARLGAGGEELRGACSDEGRAVEVDHARVVADHDGATLPVRASATGSGFAGIGVPDAGRPLGGIEDGDRARRA